MIKCGDSFIMTTVDKKSITTKTVVNRLLVTLDTPFNIGTLNVFIYDINDIPNPKNVNTPGIAMYPLKIVKTKNNKYLITDEVLREFILEQIER